MFHKVGNEKARKQSYQETGRVNLWGTDLESAVQEKKFVMGD